MRPYPAGTTPGGGVRIGAARRLRSAARVALLTATAAGCGRPVPIPPASVHAPAPRLPARADVFCLDDRAQEVIRRTNAERSRRGLAALQPDVRLQEAAQRHAADMARHDRMAHEGSDGSLAQDRVDRTGYRWTTVAENVAAGYPDAAAVVNGWMASPGHRENILDGAVRQIGVGFAYRTDTQMHTYWVQVFGVTNGVRAATEGC